jgi:hypothetical protein
MSDPIVRAVDIDLSSEMVAALGSGDRRKGIARLDSMIARMNADRRDLSRRIRESGARLRKRK